MTSTFLKSLGAGVLGLALVATPLLTFARDTNYNPRAVGSGIEVMIGQNGHVVVRGAQVTSVSDTSLTARTMWDETTITWTVRVDSDTDFVRKSGGASNIDDIATGDYVSFSGSLIGNGAFTVDADVVKNWSQSDDRTVVVGRVTSVGSDDFTLQSAGRGTVTVETQSSTSFTGSFDEFGDIVVGARLVAYGSYDSDDRVLTATQVAGNARVSAEERDKNHNRLNGWMKNFFHGWFKK